MSDRIEYAMAHPLTDPAVDDIAPYREIRQQPDGNLLVTILAVDR